MNEELSDHDAAAIRSIGLGPDNAGPVRKTAITMAKIAKLPLILEAAHLLHSLGLVSEEPASLVKRYVEANPDINKALNPGGEK